MRKYSEEQVRSWARHARQARLSKMSQKHPFLLVGLPFLIAVVGGSLVLLPSQETKYEVRDKHIQTMPIEQLKVSKRKFDIQEEYFRMQSRGDWSAEWEPKRVERPPEDEPVFDRQGPR
ncbi:Cytochrome oxidase assembly [Coemansia erecta]|uniref:Cytochrome c oxidase assembly protein COX16, mitochondrial n=1 Tax=Coemansia erecta TaxID=147472 RepID=A0A9W7XYE5_9FUNG|nr:Cytochrome oxidase assembly [Coemansia erecta]